MRVFELKTVNARLRYHDLPGRGIPIIFLHGLGCASSCDYPQVASHSSLRTRHRVLIDLLGSGFSDRPEAFGYTVDDHAQTIVALIDGLGYSKVLLVGHSMGGSIAIAVAGLSSTIRRLVVSEPNLDPGGGSFSRAVGEQREEDYVAHGHDTMIQHALEQGNDVWAASLSMSYPVAIHRGAVSLVKGSVPSWRETLTALTIPRTIIFGDRSLPDPDTERLPQHGVRVRIVRNAGHSMATENPAGVAQAISASLS